MYWRKKDSHSCSCTGKGKFGDNEKSNLCSFPCKHFRVMIQRPNQKKSAEVVEVVLVVAKGILWLLIKVLVVSWMSFRGHQLMCRGKAGWALCTRLCLEEEIQAIGRVKHPNVVKLRAYYWTPDEKLLISDFISNGNLASALRGRTGQQSSSLSWSTRLRIAKGTARGLASLHEFSPRKFVHNKSSNILLDVEFQPCISDFSLNRLINITGNNPSSSGGFIGGAFPYLKSVQPERANNYRAPEDRLFGNRPNQKLDVYSFGVVCLELLTGKSPELSSPTTSTSMEVLDLVRWIRKGFEEETPLSNMVDPLLLQEVHAKKCWRCFIYPLHAQRGTPKFDQG